MGLTNASVGRGAIRREEPTRRPEERVVALAGNPNVGKSTLFNALTGMHQHTGNWPGKTVAVARGSYTHKGVDYRLVDTPGTYSLLAHSPEEEVARDLICFGRVDAVVVVCDAACLRRHLHLALQVMESGVPTVLCVNLLDEAERRGIHPDLALLQQRLGVPVVGTVARRRRRLTHLMDAVAAVCHTPPAAPATYIRYPAPIENAVETLTPHVGATGLSPRWVCLRLLEGNDSLSATLREYCGDALPSAEAVTAAQHTLAAAGLQGDGWRDHLSQAVTARAAAVCDGAIQTHPRRHDPDRRIDRLVTGRAVGYPLMVLLLALVFWITVQGANLPSRLLAEGLFWVQDRLTELFAAVGAPAWLHGALVLGAYRVLAWVVAVMLPPMAIFFPLFTLLEDVGYLPRIAYNLDRPFCRCRACGKQALTMCMGFGCNAAGVVGCRIIDSPRERLLAILTNSLVPCNGRFPTLITLLTLFFVSSADGGLLPALLLTGVILLGVLATFGMTRLLSATLLKGAPSSFTLELPPYRRPQVGQVILRSVLDRTLFVLGRAAAVAAPAGLLIWLCANVTVGDVSLLQHGADALDPLGRLMGLDGVILIAFILGFPANEIVVPIMLMAYMATGTLTDLSDPALLGQVLTANGWTPLTALCTVLFSLFHWPCSTTLLTVRKETGGWKWVLLAAALPTALGVCVCMLVAAVGRWIA